MAVRKKKAPKKVLPPYEDYIIQPCLEKYNLHFGKELQFDEIRQWRFDFYCYEVLLAIEIQGLGRGHLSPKSYQRDIEKWNSAATQGWTILFFVPAQIRDYSYQQTLTAWLYHRREYEISSHTRRMQGMKSFVFKPNGQIVR
jgi:very-short-patch-repair endonuclease